MQSRQFGLWGVESPSLRSSAKVLGRVTARVCPRLTPKGDGASGYARGFQHPAVAGKPFAERGNVMQVIGIIMWVAGAALAGFAALFFDTTVAGFGGRIVNQDLQQHQTIMVLVGGILFLTGALLTGIAALRPTRKVDAIPGTTGKASAPVEVAPQTIADRYRGLGRW